jgi:hypothetical protein
MLDLREAEANAYAVLRREATDGEVKGLAGKEGSAFVDVREAEMYAAGEVFALLSEIRAEGRAALGGEGWRMKRTEKDDGEEKQEALHGLRLFGVAAFLFFRAGLTAADRLGVTSEADAAMGMPAGVR